MAQCLPSSVEEIWKIIVDEVTKCVLDDSPSDEILAHYLGKDIENSYKVTYILFWKFFEIIIYPLKHSMSSDNCGI